MVKTREHKISINPTPRGFEPLRAEPNGFLVHLLNHSDTVSFDSYAMCHVDTSPKTLSHRNKPMAGFEPTTSRLLSGCSTAKLHWRTLHVQPIIADTSIKFSILLKLKPTTGIEPATFCLRSRRSTTKLHWRRNLGLGELAIIALNA